MLIWKGKLSLWPRGTLLPEPTLPRVYMKKSEPGQDRSPLSTDENIRLRILCVTRLGPARRVDWLETVYMRKSWIAPQGHPFSRTEPRNPRARVSHVNGRR